jgi:catechol 2,3-dioxygenase-like lactoylglutathione lyase family enzyme
MDYKSYRRAYFTYPEPEPRFEFIGLQGIALFFNDYPSAVAYYTRVLGAPVYVEGDFTRGWRLGNTWLTLFPSQSGNPQNAEVHIYMKTPAEAERLQAAFIQAGGSGEAPSDQLMYEPIRFCPVQDPFGTSILIVSHLREGV